MFATGSFVAAIAIAGCGGDDSATTATPDGGMRVDATGMDAPADATNTPDANTRDASNDASIAKDSAMDSPVDSPIDSPMDSSVADASTDSAASDGGMTDAGMDAAPDVAADVAPAPCPDELGAYSVAIVGAGCGDLAPGAPQCIQAGATACDVQLTSQGPAGSALNAMVTLDMSGNFANGAVTEGTGNRTGCTGTWNAATSELTVDCGGVGSSQSCIATLTRTGTTCTVPPPCPDLTGAYTVTPSGAGCGDLDPTAPQCIKAGTATCDVQLVSQGTAGSALNATVSLDGNGDFTNGNVLEGTVQRSGCTGTWNAATSELTVDCGGIGSSQSCIATLTRTGTCP
jgi:hypothetical protein